LVKDINPGNSASNSSFITSINGKLYFTANDGVNGREPWVSDGSNSGTFMLKDIYPGNVDVYTNSSFRPANNKVYFVGLDGTIGKEMWETDGTNAGTIFYDICHGFNSSNPINFRDYNNEVYITANDGITGNELWKIGASPLRVEKLDINSSVNISPNPFKSQTTISFEQEQKNVTIKIMDLQGKEIKTMKFAGKQLTLESDKMSPGIYFIQVINENKNVLNKKIIVQ
jgi:ELWxxDGT repeat protein